MKLKKSEIVKEFLILKAIETRYFWLGLLLTIIGIFASYIVGCEFWCLTHEIKFDIICSNILDVLLYTVCGATILFVVIIFLIFIGWVMYCAIIFIKKIPHKIKSNWRLAKIRVIRKYK